MARWLVSFAIGLLLAGSVSAELRPFGEFWNNISYYDTNIEKKGFSSVLGRFEGKLGLFLFDTPFQIYGAYYAMSSQSPSYWNNAVYYGPGIRIMIRDVKIFAESLSSSFLKDIVSGEANKRTDTRYGIDLWHEWNLDNPDISNFWGELWANLSYRNTNFGWEPTGFNNWILYFQPKIGRHLGRGIEMYLKGDITASGKQGVDYYFLNIADYGVGIRFEPWRDTTKFKMFAEILSVSYLKDKPADLTKTVSSDVRFGIDFSFGR